jgi:glycosyltransferase involved in cell wall biosynthesis
MIAKDNIYKRRKRKLAVVIYDFEPRGVQRSQIRLANQFSEMGFLVDALVFRKKGSLVSALSDDVTVVNFDVSSSKEAFPIIVRYLRKERPIAVLSAEDHVNLLFIAAKLLLFSSVWVSISCCVSPQLWAESPRFGTKPWLTAKLVRWLYPRSDQVVMLSSGMKCDYIRLFSLTDKRLKVIGNPIIESGFRKSIEAKTHSWLENKIFPVIMGVGNLSRIKGFDVLLRAFALISREIDCRLLLVGDGPERKRLLALAEELGVSDVVNLMGFHPQPMELMKKADLFVLSSRSEGFGNVLVEAIGSGCPVISTRCGGGALEIMEHGRLGPLVDVDDVKGLAASIREVLDNPPDPEMLLASAQRFRTDVVARQYLANIVSL